MTIVRCAAFIRSRMLSDEISATFSSMHTSTAPTSVAQSSEISLSSTAPSTPTTATVIGQKLELLLSLDTALALMHASRQSLSRCATFAGYPGHYGTRVHDTIEEEFVLLLNAMGEGHIAPGFSAYVSLVKSHPVNSDKLVAQRNAANACIQPS